MDYSRFSSGPGPAPNGPEQFKPVDIDQTQHISGPDYAGMFKQAQAELAEKVAEEDAARDEALKDFDTCELPRFEQSPHHLDDFRENSAFLEAIQPLEALREERDRLRGEQDRERLLAVEGEYRKRFDEAVRPLLEARLAESAALPHYLGEDAAKYYLDFLPAVPFDEYTDYGRCMVDVDRIVSTPSFSNWSAEGNSKVEGQSDEMIVDHALSMLRGDYDVATKAKSFIKLRAGVMPGGNYAYVLDDGSHRVAAAKLIGERRLEAKVTGYNFRPGDHVARLVDAAHRQEQAEAA